MMISEKLGYLHHCFSVCLLCGWLVYCALKQDFEVKVALGALLKKLLKGYLAVFCWERPIQEVLYLHSDA